MSLPLDKALEDGYCPGTSLLSMLAEEIETCKDSRMRSMLTEDIETCRDSRKKRPSSPVGIVERARCNSGEELSIRQESEGTRPDQTLSPHVDPSLHRTSRYWLEWT